MTTLNDFNKTDLVDDHVAADVNFLISASFLSKYKNVETLSATRTLLDVDTPIQRYECGAADRIVQMPTADAVNNHPFFIVNASAAARTITVKNNAGAVILATLKQSESCMALPDGNGGYEAAAAGASVKRTYTGKTTAPAVTDDSGDGYVVGDRWIDETNNKEYVCLDNTAGAAVWTETTGSSSGDGWTAGTGTWSYSSADAPTFVISVNADVTAIIGVGQRIKLTQTTVKYFIVTAVGAYGGGVTLITVYGGTDYTLANAAITSPYWSNVKAPLGFPTNPLKWTVTLINDTSSRSQATPTTNTWYNLGTLTGSIPIGLWRVKAKLVAQSSTNASATTADIFSTLSTANNSESNNDFTAYARTDGVSGSLAVTGTVFIDIVILLASKTAYYLNAKWVNATSCASFAFRGDIAPTKVLAECAYL